MTTVPPHAQDDNTPEKKCTGPCGRTLPATTEFFNRHKRLKDGLNSQCKACKSQVDKAYRQTHGERLHAYLKDYRQSHLDEAHAYSKVYIKSHSQELRAYKQAHADEILVQRRIYNARHAEKIRQQQRDYRLAHMEEDRVHARNRHARKKYNGGTHTAADIKKQYTNQKGRCYYCQHKVGKDYEVDHVIPLSRGGSNDPSNLVIACVTCNRSKHNKLPHEWYEGGRLF